MRWQLSSMRHRRFFGATDGRNRTQPAAQAPETRLAGRTGPLKLLVFGGSLGARVLNETVPKALALFDPENRPQVLHQCGAGSVEEAKKCYADAGVEAEIVPFIEDMAKAYTESDLVICRAGATTVAELCAAGAASVLVPFVAKTTKHQLGNARYMAMNSREHEARKDSADCGKRPCALPPEGSRGCCRHD